jgi:hypothetical protein
MPVVRHENRSPRRFCRSQAAHEARIRRESCLARCDDDVVNVRIGCDNRRGGGFDEITDAGFAKLSTERPDRRSRKNDVADFPETDEEKSNLRI